MFGNGNQAWKLRRNNYGRLTTEQYEDLKRLVPKAIDTWKKVLEMNDRRYLHLQTQVAGDVLRKFVADLTHDLGDIEKKLTDNVRELLSTIDGRRKENIQDRGEQKVP